MRDLSAKAGNVLGNTRPATLPAAPKPQPAAGMLPDSPADGTGAGAGTAAVVTYAATGPAVRPGNPGR